MKHTNFVFALGLLALVVAACGSGSTIAAGGDDATPNGSYWATMVIEDGLERALVEGTQIELRFDDTQLGASAGCNSMGGTFSIADGTLQVTDMAMTEMGCDSERHAQDEFVANFLSAGPAIAIDGDTMTLTTDTTTMELLDREIADPDRPIIGTKWRVDGFFDASVASSFNVAQPAWLMFTDESTLVGFDGCADFEMDVEVSDGSTGGPIPDGADGEIQFGDPPAMPNDNCDDLPYAARLSANLRGQATYVIDGPTLTITAPDGTGVMLRTDV